MVELISLSPCAGVLPLSIGAVDLSEVLPKALTSIAPFRGQEKHCSDALKTAHGMAMPGVGRSTGKAQARAIWFSQGQALLIGPEPDAILSERAALTDQTDAWAVVRLEGRDATKVLARLVPIDLRSGSFKRGHSARTDLAHMMASLTRVGENAFQIMVFRSMAQTLVHDLKTAMDAVAARG